MRTNIGATLLVLGLLLVSSYAQAQDYPQSKTLLDTSRTVIGESIQYPKGGDAKITTKLVVLPPGDSTLWHKHGVPLYAYILSGVLDVDYGDMGKRSYRAGDNFIEAMDLFHQGHNPGQEPVQILAVFIGAEDQDLVIVKPN